MNEKISSSEKKRVEYLFEGFVSKFDIRFETFTLCFTRLICWWEERWWWSYIWKWIVYSNCWASLNITINLRHFFFFISCICEYIFFFHLPKLFIYLSLAILSDFQVFVPKIFLYQTFLMNNFNLHPIKRVSIWQRWKKKLFCKNRFGRKIKFISIFANQQTVEFSNQRIQNT